MSDQRDDNDMGEWIRNLTVRATQEQMRALRRYQELTQRIIRGELDEQSVREEYMRFAREETTRYVRDLASLSLSYYSALADLNRTFTDRFFTQVGSDPDEAQTAAPPQQVAMTLTGTVGEVAAGTFIIENQRATTIDISFLVSEFVDSGDTPFRPPLRLKPPRFSLAPNEEQAVELELPLLAELFTPGEEYRAMIVVRGYDDLELHLTVKTVEETAPGEEVTIRTPPSQPPAAAEQDLTAITGIGPTYEARLKAAGVATFAGLAALSEEQLAEILGAGPARRARNGRWVEQAELAAAADYDALAALQQRLRTSGETET